MTPESPAVEEILTLLTENPPRIAAITAGLTPAQLHAKPGPDEWSANDVLAHLRSCADVWGKCIRTLLEQDAPTLRAVSPRGYIKKTNYLDASFEQSFRAFAAQRADLLTLLRPLRPSAWARTATVKGAGAPATKTVLDFACKLAVHERHHVEQFERIATGMRA